MNGHTIEEDTSEMADCKEEDCESCKAGMEDAALCTLCAILFSSKPILLMHMKQVHGVLQPYQCFACLKRYASSHMLYQHRRSACKRREDLQQEDSGTYTLPSFVFHCQLDKWSPTYGDMLSCMSVEGGDVAVMNTDKIVGLIPQSLTNAFQEFLHHGTIHARIAGAAVNGLSGLQIPVDYMFNGNKQCLYNLIDDVYHLEEQDEPDKQYLYNLVDDVYQMEEQDKPRTEHLPSRIPSTDKRKYSQRRCMA